MNDKKEILKELEIKFNDLRKEIDFKLTLEDLDKIFSIKDYIIHTGYVREKFFNQVNQVICEYFNSWQGYLLGLLFPTSDYLIRQAESKIFSSDENKKKIWALIKSSMQFVSMGSFLTLEQDISLKKEFIENSYHFCKNSFIPELLKILEKVHSNWKENKQ